MTKVPRAILAAWGANSITQRCGNPKKQPEREASKQSAARESTGAVRDSAGRALDKSDADS